MKFNICFAALCVLALLVGDISGQVVGPYNPYTTGQAGYQRLIGPALAGGVIGYLFGKDNEESCTAGRCQNGGTCTDTSNGFDDEFTCTCATGFTGTLCEYSTTDLTTACTTDANCNTGATGTTGSVCMSGTCTCPANQVFLPNTAFGAPQTLATRICQQECPVGQTLQTTFTDTTTMLVDPTHVQFQTTTAGSLALCKTLCQNFKATNPTENECLSGSFSTVGTICRISFSKAPAAGGGAVATDTKFERNCA